MSCVAVQQKKAFDYCAKKVTDGVTKTYDDLDMFKRFEAGLCAIHLPIECSKVTDQKKCTEGCIWKNSAQHKSK